MRKQALLLLFALLLATVPLLTGAAQRESSVGIHFTAPPAPPKPRPDRPSSGGGGTSERDRDLPQSANEAATGAIPEDAVWALKPHIPLTSLGKLPATGSNRLPGALCIAGGTLLLYVSLHGKDRRTASPPGTTAQDHRQVKATTPPTLFI